VNHSGYTDKTIERDAIWLAQTPQAFQYSLIKKAHETARQKGYTCTDDAQLVERMGKEVKIISGSRYNIKITNREDLELARAILRARAG
jgi:2-C-methyl-D-erythritol 4-phosphate cytidylyltransferase